MKMDREDDRGDFMQTRRFSGSVQRKREWGMYGWGGRRNLTKEVKLVRVMPYDNRAGRQGGKHKAGKALALFLAAAFTLSVFLIGFYVVFDSIAKEKALETAGGLQEEDLPGEGAGEGDAQAFGPGDFGRILPASDVYGTEGLYGPGILCDARLLQSIAQGFSRDSQDVGQSSGPGGVSDAQGVPGGADPEGGKAPEGDASQSEPGADGPRAPLIAIDPGHGGGEEGCGGDGALEARENLELALLLSAELEKLGFGTLLTREDDTCLMPEERAQKAQEAGADIYISLHGNDVGKGKKSGIGTLYDGESEEARRLARLVSKGALRKTKALDGGVGEYGEAFLSVLPDMPSCMVDAGFWISDDEEDGEFKEYRRKLAEGIAQGIDLYFNPKTMYLTFDDGPSKDNTSAVLDVLKQKGVKATFFVVGENVRKNPEVARRIVEEGHTIGIHCNHHVYEDLYQSVDSYLEDFREAYDAVREVTGVEVVLFRFPGGSINSYNEDVYEGIIEKMEEGGFIYFDWNASLEDAAKNTTPEQLIQNAVNSAMGRTKVVMLAHDIKSDTAQCLEELIDSFPEYKMEALDPEVVPVHF